MARRSKALLLVAGALSVAACHKQQQQQTEQNIVVDNGVLANAEIETLPADEGSGDNYDANDLNASTNAH